MLQGAIEGVAAEYYWLEDPYFQNGILLVQ